MKVWILENGSYSDTHVVGVYSTEDNAQLAATHFADCPGIEAYELDAAVEDMRDGRKPYFVRLHRVTGTVLDAHVFDSSYGAFDSTVHEDGNKNLYTQCWADDNEHAVKIAADRRREFLATGQL